MCLFGRIEESLVEKCYKEISEKIRLLYVAVTRAKEKILAVDSSKFDQVAFAEIGSLDQITTIVTDAKPETRWLQHFDKIGVKCIYPK